MGGDSTKEVNLVSGATFTSADSYVCTGMVRLPSAGSSTGNTTLSIYQASGSNFVIHATKGTVVNYMCIGN
jgi:hypothetical protein